MTTIIRRSSGGAKPAPPQNTSLEPLILGAESQTGLTDGKAPVTATPGRTPVGFGAIFNTPTSFGGPAGGEGGGVPGAGPDAIQVAQNSALTQEQIANMLYNSGWLVVSNMPASATVTIDGDDTTALDGDYGRYLGWAGGDATNGAGVIAIDAGRHLVTITDNVTSAARSATVTIVRSGASSTTPDWDPTASPTPPAGISVSSLNWATMAALAQAAGDAPLAQKGVNPALIVAGVVVVGAVAFFALRKPRANPRKARRNTHRRGHR